VTCVLHDIHGSRTVGQWDTALNCIITYFSQILRCCGGRGTPVKVVACVIHDICSSRTVGKWYTALNCITKKVTNPSLLWWENTTSGFPLMVLNYFPLVLLKSQTKTDFTQKLFEIIEWFFGY
jgi:hypothetical protein